jgi:hypothetical protein
MGCCIPIDNEKYFEFSKNDEERDFRLWEKKLGFYRNTFKNVQPLLMLDEHRTTNIEVIKAVLTRNFSESFANLLTSPILNENGTIKNDKLLLLVFLACIHTLNRADGVLYCDKALYLFSLINKPDEVETNAPIEKTNNYLRTIIDQLLSISSLDLYNEYSKGQANTRDGMFKLIPKYKEHIISKIINDLFNFKGKEMSSISFNEFNLLFMTHPNVC